MINYRMYMGIITLFLLCYPTTVLSFSSAVSTIILHNSLPPRTHDWAYYRHRGNHRSIIPHFMKSSSSPSGDAGDDTTNDLLKTAARLRKEAEALEQSVRRNRNPADSTMTSATTKKQGNDKLIQETAAPVRYTSLKDSTWMISYRFASDAVNRNKNKNDDDHDDVKPIFYSGKVKVTFTADGYTNLLPNNVEKDSSATMTSTNQISFVKFWGWDEETSRDDGMQYVLFSADVLLPESDPNFTKMAKRFYFQCRLDRDAKSQEISMSDGTVTVKKDVEPPGGFWGVFNAGGILAQFRYCGDFVMKPCPK